MAEAVTIYVAQVGQSSSNNRMTVGGVSQSGVAGEAPALYTVASGKRLVLKGRGLSVRWSSSRWNVSPAADVTSNLTVVLGAGNIAFAGGDDIDLSACGFLEEDI